MTTILIFFLEKEKRREEEREKRVSCLSRTISFYLLFFYPLTKRIPLTAIFHADNHLTKKEKKKGNLLRENIFEEEKGAESITRDGNK